MIADFKKVRFNPLQPSGIINDKLGVIYKEILPCEILQPYIHCFWQLSCRGKSIVDYPYDVIADGVTDLIFSGIEKPESLFSVTSQDAFTINLSGNFDYFGIRFYPGCIHHFLNISLSELSGKTFQADEVFGNVLKDIEQKILEAKSFSEKKLAVEKDLSEKLSKTKFKPDMRFMNSLYHIFESGGNASIQAQVADLISHRQMRRMFEHYIGLSPKMFSRIVRFQQILFAMKHASQRNKATLFFDYGYYDQSHFIRDFKKFYGETPGKM